ncbi:Guanine nucleotide-binding protein subunit beta-like protein [Sphaceloma murrayae]|uniref:ATP phosphoribosyltransferase n=1 Tax=Sphaceloma murrayae TaxID=2082308 RepID=A0A2K1R1T7_9PEZI|nr:Guanine nucleotide-binding protein subunit beta-like protein [Sphaceloma murrayae]
MSSTSSPSDRYKLVFFTPPLDLQKVKTAIFSTGAGTIGKYHECCFTTPGVGQFRPGNGTNPHIGEAGKVEEVGEVRCEILCNGREQARSAVQALKSSHPYEEPAYEVYKVEDL